MKRIKRSELLVGCWLLASCTATGADIICDFEKELGGWTAGTAGGRLERSTDFPLSGEYGLLFSHEKWIPEEHDGNSTWPAISNRHLPKDWSSYDRLVIPVYNDSEAQMMFAGYLADSKTEPVVKGAPFMTKLPPFSHTVVVMDLKKELSRKRQDPSDIAILHLFSENPASDMRLYIDRITLLKPGEAMPETPTAYLQKIQALRDARNAKMKKRFAERAAQLNFASLNKPLQGYFRQWVQDYLTAWDSRASSKILQKELRTGYLFDLMEQRLHAVKAFEKIRAQVTCQQGFDDVVLGYEPSTAGVLPQDAVFQPLPIPVKIAAAGNEKESFQLVVFSCEKELKNVSVTFSDFQGPEGTLLPPEAVSVDVVGFVKPKTAPIFHVDYMGYYSDPLFASVRAVNVPRGAAQPFWVRFSIPKSQAPGIYRGEVNVNIAGRKAFASAVELQVFGFSLEDRSPLPLAVTFAPVKLNSLGTIPPDQTSAAPYQAWKRHKKEWVRMLGDYYLAVDSLYDEKHYPGWDVDFDALLELKARGKLTAFNLGYYPPCKSADEMFGKRTLEPIRRRYAKARELGLAEYAYIYGCDEIPAARHDEVNRAAAAVKKEFPGVPVMTTSHNESFGVSGNLTEPDIYCPLVPKYDAVKAEIARQSGKKVWWYVCAGVAPRAYVETPPYELRLLMGAMTAKFRPDGFLYYQISMWNSRACISEIPYTSFNISSFQQWDGDGIWVYPGADGVPVASIRLENFRDGLEDFAYVRLLESLLDKVPADSEWSRSAREALRVPGDVVGEKTTEPLPPPVRLPAWRARLAELIEHFPGAR